MISPVALPSRYCTSLKWIAVSLSDHQLPSEVYIHDEPVLLYIMARVARCKMNQDDTDGTNLPCWN